MGYLQVAEDISLVISIQRKFSFLQSVPGVCAIQRPYLPIQHPYVIKPNIQLMENNIRKPQFFELVQSFIAQLLISCSEDDKDPI